MPYSHLRDRAINETMFRVVANYTYDWESWHDPIGKPIWINDAVERMTGYSVDTCMKMEDYPLPIVAPDDQSRMRQMLKDAIEKKSHNDLEFQIVTRGGEQRWMAVSWQPMYDDDRKHLGFRTSVRDVTDRQALKKQLRLYTEHLEQLVQERTAKIAQLEKNRRQMEKLAALGELAAGVAHEVNNPLAGIRNAFALFRDGLTPEHQHYELLELVDNEIERISSIVHQMYQLYRRNPQPATELTIEKTLRDVVCLLEPIAKRHQVELKLLPETSPTHCQTTKLRLPEGELKQVLFNLIRNAIQASEPRQRVNVTIEPAVDDVLVRVQDHGSGIPDDVLPHIFEPFFSTKGQLKEGMGLGLSVSQNLIEAMGGSLDVKTSTDNGTTFTIYLPR